MNKEIEMINSTDNIIVAWNKGVPKKITPQGITAGPTMEMITIQIKDVHIPIRETELIKSLFKIGKRERFFTDMSLLFFYNH